MIPLDIECTGLDFNRDNLLGVGLGTNFHKGSYSFTSVPVTCQNFRYEYKFIKKHLGIEIDCQFDTLLSASILIDRPTDLDLGTLASYYLGMADWKSDTDKLFKKKGWVQMLKNDPALFRKLAKRNLADLRATEKLTAVLHRKMTEEGIADFFYRKLMPAARMMAQTEYHGIPVDLNAIDQKLVDINHKLADLEKELKAWAGDINFNSPKQLMEALKGKGYKLWYYDFKSRGMKEGTGVEVLESLLPNPHIQKLLDFRGAQKTKGFLTGWKEEHYNGRLHASFNLASTRTGRLSSSNPNVQQVPRDSDMRSIFIANPGKKLIIGDFASIEPRLAAHFSKDETLLNVFRNNEDFYGSIAVRVLGVDCHPNDVKKLYPVMRKVAKEIGLGILYGIGADKLISLIKRKTSIVFSKAQGKQIIRDYFKAYPGLLEFREYVINKIDHGEILRSPFGRQYKISPDKAFSTGINTIIQGTASDACLFPQLEVDRQLKELGIDAPLLLLCHDEAVREARPEDAETVGKIMEKVLCSQPFDCPLKFEWCVADSWAGKS